MSSLAKQLCAKRVEQGTERTTLRGNNVEIQVPGKVMTHSEVSISGNPEAICRWRLQGQKFRNKLIRYYDVEG